jgi:maltooligosyltrehalose trehalohydrolase
MLSGHNFLAYLQNHDQVGNRARGERSSQLMGIGRLKIAAALILTSPFIPMLFQGEEWGPSTPFQYFTDHQDPELGEAISKGRQEEFSAFGWNPEEIPDPQEVETFERSKLKWAEKESEPHRSILEWHKKLIRLRRTIPDLADGRLDRVQTGFDEEKKWLWVQRGAVTVACNLAAHPQQIGVPYPQACLLLASEPGVEVEEGTIRLPADSVAVIKTGSGMELAFQPSVR